MRIRVVDVSIALLVCLVFAGVPVGSPAAELRIAATVTPVHSLVSMVSKGVATPDLIIRPGASPHSYALKPSEAKALDEADLVFWVGEGLEPWMAKAVTTLANDAVVVELGEIDGVRQLTFRESGVWAEHGHDEEGSESHGHDHHHAGRFDPHLWLDPDNALIWLDQIAETLSEQSPAQTEVFHRNAKAAARRIENAVAEIERQLQPVKEKPYVVFHDAYQYFERRFDLRPLGAISLGDADRPGPARLLKIREIIAVSGAACVFAEPQFEPKLIETVIEGSGVKMGTLDPVGASLPPGAGLYPQLLLGLAENLADCLG